MNNDNALDAQKFVRASGVLTSPQFPAGRPIENRQFTVRGDQVAKELEERGIAIRAKSFKTIAEEAPQAYKDESKVVEICHNAGRSEKMASKVPLGVVKVSM